MKYLKTTIAAVTVLFGTAAALFGTAAAAQETGDITAGLGTSSLGLVLEGSYRATPDIGIRGMQSIGSGVNTTVDIEGIPFDASLDLGGTALLVDYYPTSGGFRFTGGLLASRFNFGATATATAANPITVNGTTFSSGETVTTNFGYVNDVNPVFAMGYSRTWVGGFSLGSDFGLIYTGGYEFSASSPDIAQNQLDAEFADVNTELANFKVYPFVSTTFSYRF